MNPIQMGGRKVPDGAKRPREVGFNMSKRGVENGVEAKAETLSAQVSAGFTAAEEGGKLVEVASTVRNGGGSVKLGDEPTDFSRGNAGVAFPDGPPESGEEVEAGQGAVEGLSGERADLGEFGCREFR